MFHPLQLVDSTYQRFGSSAKHNSHRLCPCPLAKIHRRWSTWSLPIKNYKKVRISTPKATLQPGDSLFQRTSSSRGSAFPAPEGAARVGFYDNSQMVRCTFPVLPTSEKSRLIAQKHCDATSVVGVCGKAPPPHQGTQMPWTAEGARWDLSLEPADGGSKARPPHIQWWLAIRYRY